jgi:SAM-dependent methyltransferase
MGTISIGGVRSPADIIADGRHAEYTQYNVKRHATAYAACITVRPDPETQVLDVGDSDFTRQLRGHYRDVWTLGFLGPSSKHIVYDLNDSPIFGIDCDRQFDMITFNEVIEHLYTAPETVMTALARLLRPGGHMVLQTPNAAALNKRLLLLIGKNPFERLRVDHTNPGHLRELTKAELAEVARATGFDIVDHRCIEYAGVYGRSWRNFALPLLRAVAAIWPTFARSQQIVLRKR